jgi:hypothetical protein
MPAHGQEGQNLDPGIRSILEELRHTRILDRIDRKFGARGNGRPGQDHARGA